MIEGSTVVITGGAGFIGCWLAETLLERNKVVLLDTSFDKKPLQYSAKRDHPNLSCVVGNVLDYDSIARVVASADVVIHLASIVGVNTVRRQVQKTLNVNCSGTLNVLRSTEAGGRCKRFLYFSTSEVFGMYASQAREDTPCVLGHVTEGRWSYAISKLAAEHLVFSFHQEAGLPTTIVRPFNVFGPKRTGEHAIVAFAVRALLGNPLEVHGDGSQIRAWCYIQDLCEAVHLMLERPEAVGEDFNVGNARNTLTIHQLARRVVELTGSSSPIHFVPHEGLDVQVRTPCIDKIQQRLNFEPCFELDDGLLLTIDWYREHLSDFVQHYG